MSKAGNFFRSRARENAARPCFRARSRRYIEVLCIGVRGPSTSAGFSLVVDPPLPALLVTPPSGGLAGVALSAFPLWAGLPALRSCCGGAGFVGAGSPVHRLLLAMRPARDAPASEPRKRPRRSVALQSNAAVAGGTRSVVALSADNFFTNVLRDDDRNWAVPWSNTGVN